LLQEVLLDAVQLGLSLGALALDPRLALFPRSLALQPLLQSVRRREATAKAAGGGCGVWAGA